MLLNTLVLVVLHSALRVSGLEVLSGASNETTHSITVHASSHNGKFKNVQGTMNIDDFWLPPGTGNNGTDKDDSLGRLYPSYGIKDVLLYTFPAVWKGWETPGLSTLNNDDYNWTAADEWINFVVSNGAKASLDFRPPLGANLSVTSYEQLGEIGFMLADRYMNGAHGSGFKDALHLIDFYPESDVADFDDIEERYQKDFRFFAAFARGVKNASEDVKVGAWGGNRAFLLDNNYTVPSPYVSRFYRDCVEHNVPIGAATWHFTSTFFSFNPYDIKTVTDHLRINILAPAGLPDLPIYVTHVQPNPRAMPVEPHLDAYAYDAAFLASFQIGTAMYAQDTSLEVIFPWAGFSYGGIAGASVFFMGFFNKTVDNETLPLNAARAVSLQNTLIRDTPVRLQVDGHSPEGFAALSGVSEDGRKIQVLLNNYQLDYDLPRAISKAFEAHINRSTAADPIFQDNGLLNTESLCLNRGNTFSVLPVCPTFPCPTTRDNQSTAYHLRLVDLPWPVGSSYRVDVQRIGSEDDGSEPGFLQQSPEEEVSRLCLGRRVLDLEIDIALPFAPNAQDLVTISLVD